VDNGFRKLPPKFLLFTSLTNLVLRRNELIELPDHLHLFPSLTGLHVEGNLITSLPPSFAVLTNLTVLELLLGVARTVHDLPSDVQELTLSANRLAELPDCVCRMTKLVRLSVDSNFLERLPSKIGKLTRLKYLCCSRNRITHLPKSIVQLKRLKHLIAYQNRLGDRGIPDCICDMEGLKELQLSYNNISRLPYRFTSGGIMKSLKKLWLYGNCFFDVGDLPLRLASVQDFRIDINPLKSPPAEYTARQIVGLMEYTSLRIARMREIQRRCEAEGWILDPTRFVPVAARDGHVIVGGFGTLNEDELTRFDQFVER
jgi:Leucine rich repeat